MSDNEKKHQTVEYSAFSEKAGETEKLLAELESVLVEQRQHLSYLENKSNEASEMDAMAVELGQQEVGKQTNAQYLEEQIEQTKKIIAEFEELKRRALNNIRDLKNIEARWTELLLKNK